MTERISSLRRRMIEDMNARQLSAGTQKAHIRGCKRFAAFLGRSPETASREDIRRFQHHLADDAVSLGTRNVVMTGVKFLFRVTLRRLDLVEEIYHLSEPQRVPVILSVNEVRRLPTRPRSTPISSLSTGPTLPSMPRNRSPGRKPCSTTSPATPTGSPSPTEG